MNPLQEASNQAGINQWLERGPQFVSKNEWKTVNEANKALNILNQTLEGKAYLVKRTSGNTSVALDTGQYHYFENITMSDFENAKKISKFMEDFKKPPKSIQDLLTYGQWPPVLENKFKEAGTKCVGNNANYSISEVEVDGEKKYRIKQTLLYQMASVSEGKPKIEPVQEYEIELTEKEYKILQTKAGQKPIKKD